MLEEIRILTCHPDGNHAGDIEKVAAHVSPGVLHRAFSAILADECGRVVLQRRSAHKMLWPSFWSNACCSHYRAASTEIAQVEQRIREELGCKASNLVKVSQFQYRARYLSVGVESEVCDIWIGMVRSSEIAESADEVDAIAFVNPTDMNAALQAQPSSFTPWFALEWPMVSSRFASFLSEAKSA